MYTCAVIGLTSIGDAIAGAGAVDLEVAYCSLRVDCCEPGLDERVVEGGREMVLRKVTYAASVMTRPESTMDLPTLELASVRLELAKSSQREFLITDLRL